ncbi:hypothetical protein DSO57_1038271 [Entomophthora muscae]|uniref:Uncharacterized protein n=2 Tax=Entomophthora muscae TaxID=34485 RepID=A0ACC2SVC8_9FUNG|nr:hypothetical protein DSO57_1010307 [Entomophthora muscae]KAJ9083082.1 hypothetical protein DSO57_1038271 [Entomophthora muscae]
MDLSIDQRRTRASRDQLAVLEDAFAKNSQPNAKMRETLSARLGMTERSVQIWFQNRRAKIKLSQRKMHMALKEEALRQHCMAAYSSRPPILPPHLSRSAPLPAHPTFDQPRHCLFPCSVLTIGTWKRMPVASDDLMCGFHTDKSDLAWLIGDSLTKFKISFPFKAISSIQLKFMDQVYAELSFCLNAPPTFNIMSQDGAWVACGDFTENLQASHVLKHSLLGDSQGLRVQLLALLEQSHDLSQKTTILPFDTTPRLAPHYSEPENLNRYATPRSDDKGFSPYMSPPESFQYSLMDPSTMASHFPSAYYPIPTPPSSQFL